MHFVHHILPPCARSQSVLCLSFSTAQWKDLSVGDVLRIRKDQVFPVRFSIYKKHKLTEKASLTRLQSFLLTYAVES